MKNFRLFIAASVLIVSLSTKAEASWQNYLHSQIPLPLKFLLVKKTKLKEVEKQLGKASLVEKNKHYYEQGGFKYSLEIVYSNDVVQEVSYTFINNRPDFGSLKVNLNKLTNYPTSGGAAGRYLKYADKFGEVIVDPIERNIYSVRFR